MVGAAWGEGRKEVCTPIGVATARPQPRGGGVGSVQVLEPWGMDMRGEPRIQWAGKD